MQNNVLIYTHFSDIWAFGVNRSVGFFHLFQNALNEESKSLPKNLCRRVPFLPKWICMCKKQNLRAWSSTLN